MYYLGIDIGGTFIKYALIHKNMKLLKLFMIIYVLISIILMKLN